MAIGTELFKAILAMDSYNRGYDGGVDAGVDLANAGRAWVCCQ